MGEHRRVAQRDLGRRTWSGGSSRCVPRSPRGSVHASSHGPDGLPQSQKWSGAAATSKPRSSRRTNRSRYSGHGTFGRHQHLEPQAVGHERMLVRRTSSSSWRHRRSCSVRGPMAELPPASSSMGRAGRRPWQPSPGGVRLGRATRDRWRSPSCRSARPSPRSTSWPSASPSPCTTTVRAPTGRGRSTSSRGSSPPRSGRAIERGLKQRLDALNRFIDDVYHDQPRRRRRRVPRRAAWRARSTCAPSAPACHRSSACGPTSAAATSFAMPTGTVHVLEDNLRVPSGVSYLLREPGDLQARLRRPVRAAVDPAGRRLPGPAAPAARCRWPPTTRGRCAIAQSSCSPRASTTAPTSSTRFLAQQMGVRAGRGRRPVRRPDDRV